MPNPTHSAARRAYERVRPWMPPVRRVRLAGVPTGAWRRLSDFVVPRAWAEGRRDEPLYEDALVDGLRAHGRPGDRVVVVGVGHGVTSVIAAQIAGPAGTVDAYEASDGMLGVARKTLGLTAAGRRVRLHHAVVGAAHGVYGWTSAAVVPAPDLPPCDVLVMDCEGAERDILPALPHAPRVVLVETHGFLGAPTPLVRRLLEGARYRVVSDRIAEVRYADVCVEKDVRVLAALAGPAGPPPAAGPPAPDAR